MRSPSTADKAGPARMLLTLGIVLGIAALAQPDNATTAAWNDSASVSGTTISTDVLAAPTGVTVTQSCVADPAPVWRGAAGGTTTSGTVTSGSLTLAKPADAAVGDVLLAGLLAAGNYSSSTLNAPPGWTLVRQDRANQGGQFVYTRVVGASEPSSYAWGNFVGAGIGGMAAFSGVDTTTPVNVSSGQTDSNVGVATAPSVTTTRANVLLVGIFGVANPVHQTPPATMSTMWSVFSSSGVSSLGTRELWLTPGATGPRSATATGAQSVGQLIALQPPIFPFATTTWTRSSSGYATGQTFVRSSGGTQQRVATLPPTATSEYDGPLTTGTPYSMSVEATFNNWISAPGSTSFTARAC